MPSTSLKFHGHSRLSLSATVLTVLHVGSSPPGTARSFGGSPEGLPGLPCYVLSWCPLGTSNALARDLIFTTVTALDQSQVQRELSLCPTDTSGPPRDTGSFHSLLSPDGDNA